MGFDLSGVNPQINKSESEYKHYKETNNWNIKKGYEEVVAY